MTSKRRKKHERRQIIAKLREALPSESQEGRGSVRVDARESFNVIAGVFGRHVFQAVSLAIRFLEGEASSHRRALTSLRSSTVDDPPRVGTDLSPRRLRRHRGGNNGRPSRPSPVAPPPPRGPLRNPWEIAATFRLGVTAPLILPERPRESTRGTRKPRHMRRDFPNRWSSSTRNWKTAFASGPAR